MTSEERPRSTVAAAWRFLIVGGSNTLVTTLILVGLSYLLPGWLAYTIAFGLGLIYNTLLASRWVFTRSGTPRATLLYAASYVVIYVVGLGCVAIIHTFHWPQFANALSVIVTAPLGFVAGRLIFRERQRESAVRE